MHNLRRVEERAEAPPAVSHPVQFAPDGLHEEDGPPLTGSTSSEGERERRRPAFILLFDEEEEEEEERVGG